MRFIYFIILFAFCLNPVFSQKNMFTISGYVTDAASGERLQGATIYAPKYHAGTTANQYGFYSLSLVADSVYLQASFVGYKSQRIGILLNQNRSIQIALELDSNGQTVEISGDRGISDRVQMGAISIPVSQIQKLPTLLGEADVLKAIQLLPGVQSGVEGTSGMYVRGGGPDQNLILLDGAPVYNVSHAIGFFSVFNADAIQYVELIKGGFPARYGGRLSSVLDISMKEGNMKETHVDGAIGLVASHLTVQGPLIKNKMSFLVAGRRTYIDALLKPYYALKNANKTSAFTPSYHFYDLNAKLNYILSSKDHLYLSAYRGKDNLVNSFVNKTTETSTEKRTNEGYLEWQNLTSTLRWNHLFSPKLFMNAMTYFTQYDVENAVKQSVTTKSTEGKEATSISALSYQAGIRDWSVRVDVDYVPNPRHNIKIGGWQTWHRYRPGVSVLHQQDAQSNVDSLLTPNVSEINNSELASYVEDEWAINTRLKVNMGLHYAGTVVEGKSYFSLQPRFSMRYKMGDIALKASFVTMQQNIHLLGAGAVGIPIDMWLPVTRNILPQKSWQAAIGFSKDFSSKGLEFSIEAYYKPMRNLLEFKEGTSFISDFEKKWEDKVTQGNGEAYGIEFFLQKKIGRTTGWIGYTLAWNYRKFEAINEGKTYPYRYDRRHDIAVVVQHELRSNIDVAGNWVYATGNAITLPISTYRYPGEGSTPWRNSSYDYNTVTEYSNTNGLRLPSYHRLDLSFNFHRDMDWGKRTLSVGAYNAYSRNNPVYVFLEKNDYGGQQYKAVGLFPIIPHINYQFSF
jgi:hypothetical protein